MVARGTYVFRRDLSPRLNHWEPQCCFCECASGPGLSPCFYLPKCPAGREPAAEGTSAREDMFPPPVSRVGGRAPPWPISLPKCCTNPGTPLGSPPPFILQNPHVITRWD